MTLIMEYFFFLLVMKYRILIQIYIIKIQTIWNGRIVKENYWIKNNFLLTVIAIPAGIAVLAKAEEIVPDETRCCYHGVYSA